MLQYERNHWGSALQLVGGAAALLDDPLVSPVRADWGGAMFARRRFPAVLIQIGLRDSLLSAATLLYRRLAAAGLRAPLVFSPWEAMWHVFQQFLADPTERLPEAAEAAAEAGAFLAKHVVGAAAQRGC